jgi:hypothetical protein
MRCELPLPQADSFDRNQSHSSHHKQQMAPRLDCFPALGCSFHSVGPTTDQSSLARSQSVVDSFYTRQKPLCLQYHCTENQTLRSVQASHTHTHTHSLSLSLSLSCERMHNRLRRIPRLELRLLFGFAIVTSGKYTLSFDNPRTNRCQLDHSLTAALQCLYVTLHNLPVHIVVIHLCHERFSPQTCLLRAVHAL